MIIYAKSGMTQHDSPSSGIFLKVTLQQGRGEIIDVSINLGCGSIHRGHERFILAMNLEEGKRF